MSQICPIREHYGAAITHICANTNCAQNRLLCNQCIGYLHPTCGNYLLNIDAVLKKDYSLNTNWIQDKNLRDAVGTVERYKLTNDRDQVIKQTRIQIEKEYESLVAAFAQEVNVAKSKTIQRFNQSVTPITDVNFTDFTSRYKNIYNFPNFIEILNQWKKGSQNVETISKRLDTFFRDSVTNEQANQTLLAAAQRINAHSQQCTSIFTTLPFDQFKRNISMEIAKLEPEQAVQAVIAGPGQGSVNVPPSSQLWSWDAQRISSMLQLSSDCLEVSKMPKTQWKDSAVLGNLKMTGGRYQWAINVGDVSTRWICFGVIEPQYAEDLENFGFDKSCGFSLLSQRYNMVGDVTLSNYRERSYLCDLDLVNGTFRISTKTGEAGQEKDVELAKEKESLKGKAFLPYIVMYLPGNAATLRVIVGSAAAIPQPQPEADPSQQRPSMMISGQVGGGGVPGSIMAIK